MVKVHPSRLPTTGYLGNCEIVVSIGIRSLGDGKKVDQVANYSHSSSIIHTQPGAVSEPRNTASKLKMGGELSRTCLFSSLAIVKNGVQEASRSPFQN